MVSQMRDSFSAQHPHLGKRVPEAMSGPPVVVSETDNVYEVIESPSVPASHLTLPEYVPMEVLPLPVHSLTAGSARRITPPSSPVPLLRASPTVARREYRSARGSTGRSPQPPLSPEPAGGSDRHVKPHSHFVYRSWVSSRDVDDTSHFIADQPLSEATWFYPHISREVSEDA